MNQKSRVIAIDGPVAAGKGTIALLLGKRLHGFPLNSGAMYRMLALYCLEHQIPVTKQQEVIDALAHITLDLDETRAFLNGEDVTEKIKKREIAQIVSKVATIGEIRLEMVKRQQEMGEKKIKEGMTVVVEGRDAATKIFPNALLKVFLTARPEIRARRRYEQMGGKANNTIDYDKILADTNERDTRDYNRAVDPLVKDPQQYGYFVLDNSDMTEEQTVRAVLDKWEKLQ